MRPDDTARAPKMSENSLIWARLKPVRNDVSSSCPSRGNTPKNSRGLATITKAVSATAKGHCARAAPSSICRPRVTKKTMIKKFISGCTR